MVNIEIYTRATCPYCRRVKELFTRRKVLYQEIPIDGNVDLREEMIKRSGRITVPQIFIDGKHMGGCNDLHTLDARGDLVPLIK